MKHTVNRNTSHTQGRRSTGLILPVVAMCLTLGMLVASGTAWLTANRKANSNGVQMTVKSTSNLVIGQTVLEVQSATPKFTTTFTANTNTYFPATHIFTTNAADYGETGLQYLENDADTDQYTGFVPVGVTEIFAKVPSETDSAYYKDFTVYIASAGEELTDYDLTVKVGTPTNIASLTDTAKALSIDFYVGTTAKSGYCGTLNLAGLNAYTNNGEAPREDVSLIIPDDTIPDNHSDPLLIYMRVYFDGNLKKSDGDAFVRTENVVTTTFEFGLEFSATPLDDGEE